jgi:hypothetical protein
MPSIYYRRVGLWNLGNRAEILMLLQALPSSPVAEVTEILEFIENNSLMGRDLLDT